MKTFKEEKEFQNTDLIQGHKNPYFLPEDRRTSTTENEGMKEWRKQQLHTHIFTTEALKRFTHLRKNFSAIH